MAEGSGSPSPEDPKRRHKGLPRTPDAALGREGSPAPREGDAVTSRRVGRRAHGRPHRWGHSLRPRWPLPPTCGGHPTPRHLRDRRGAPALPARETNSGEGAPGPCAPAHAQARAEQGAAGRLEDSRVGAGRANAGGAAQPHRGARAPEEPERSLPGGAPAALPPRPARPPARRARGSPGGRTGDPGHTRRRRRVAVRGSSPGRTPRRGRGPSALPRWGPGENPAP